VLPAALNCPNPPDGVCTRDATVLDAYRPRFTDHVSWGYINLPADIRQIPLRRANVDSGTLDSLSQALAAAGPSQFFPPRLEGTREFPYGSFISEQAFAEAHSVFRAGDIANNSPALASVRGKSVLIGGSWHASAFGRGPMVDAHVSPVGSIPGVYMHANYAAAILDGRYYAPAGKVLSSIVDVTIIAAIAVLFALPMGWPRRWLWVGFVGLAISIVSYLLWQNLGLFLEATIPCVLLFCHSLFDEYLKMREELVALRAQAAQGRGRKKTET